MLQINAICLDRLRKKNREKHKIRGIFHGYRKIRGRKQSF